MFRKLLSGYFRSIPANFRSIAANFRSIGNWDFGQLGHVLGSLKCDFQPPIVLEFRSFESCHGPNPPIKLVRICFQEI